jgi:hypothetical protein
MNPRSPPISVTSAASARLDLVGVVASSACLVHCLATPLLVVFFPLVADARFEGVLAVILVVFATLSASLALARRRVLPMLTFSLGLAALAVRRGFELAEGSSEERIIVVIAAGLMIATHLLSLTARSADAEAGPAAR